MVIKLSHRFMVFLAHDGLARNVSGFGVPAFAMMSYSAATIMPAAIMIMLVQDKIGRKAMGFTSLMLCGLFTLATGFIVLFHRNSWVQSKYMGCGEQ